MFPESDVIIKAEEINLSLNHRKILSNISLNVYENEILGVVGVSGSGKTTLLMTLLGLLKPDSGEIMFRHKTKDAYIYKSIFSNLDYFRSHIGFSTQQPSFYSKLTVLENLTFFGRMYSLKDKQLRQRISILLDLFELKDHKNKTAEELSGGMQKRLDMAIAIIHNPLILVLDEPTGELDPLLRKEMWFLIEKINKSGKTIILSSHFIDEMEHLCNRIVVLNDGSIAALGTPMEIRERLSSYEQVVIETFPGNYDLILKKISLNSKIRVKKYTLRSNQLTLYVDDGQEAIQEIIPLLNEYNEKIIDLQLRKLPLETIFELFG